jgi:hypothetical protein
MQLRKLLRFNRSFKTRGVVGTLRHYVAVVASMVASIAPTARRERKQRRELDLAFASKREAIDADFDSRHRLDTGGKIELADLSVESETKEHGVFYQAVFPNRFRHWIDSLHIEPSEFLFVDIGAGKGRALFLAQDIGFKRVVGVEFANELVETCKKNIQVREAECVYRPPVSIVHMDAVRYLLPDEQTVHFINNPFDQEVMGKFVERVRQSLLRAPRPLKIVYGNPLWDRVIMSGIPGLRRVAQTELFNSYEWTGMESVLAVTNK